MRYAVAARFLVALLGVALTACLDPVHADAVAELGPEPDGVPSAQHRPGQPCATCHTSKGPSSLELSVAGTVFATRGAVAPSAGVAVTITDGAGETRLFTTNEGGNFYASKDDWDPWFPLAVEVEAGGKKRTMASLVGREASCASCHRGAGDATHMPGVFVSDQ